MFINSFDTNFKKQSPEIFHQKKITGKQLTFAEVIFLKDFSTDVFL